MPRVYVPYVHGENVAETLSGGVQCFVARSAYWITMNPLTVRRKAAQGCNRDLCHYQRESREKVSPLYTRKVRDVLETSPGRPEISFQGCDRLKNYPRDATVNSPPCDATCEDLGHRMFKYVRFIVVRQICDPSRLN